MRDRGPPRGRPHVGYRGHVFGTDASPRPELRRPPRDELAVYRVRVDLDQARPPIWRRLDLRSDVTLDVPHQVLQAAFSWLDYHLHRSRWAAARLSPTARCSCARTTPTTRNPTTTVREPRRCGSTKRCRIPGIVCTISTTTATTGS
ncbi:plasmid pRiA4b ORF-3 family protein [Mycolicibacterium pulveris]|uniref:plasmid pRiA4b ORF-3 family protein n=1 Tax=Mycolicibacterium pulveris TaxID=36813 RepID=UPI0021F2F261|nr:plasmid pRiA4b ORF-3 family protein [Mycolicibacterium pulveris]